MTSKGAFRPIYYEKEIMTTFVMHPLAIRTDIGFDVHKAHCEVWHSGLEYLIRKCERLGEHHPASGVQG